MKNDIYDHNFVISSLVELFDENANDFLQSDDVGEGNRVIDLGRTLTKWAFSFYLSISSLYSRF